VDVVLEEPDEILSGVRPSGIRCDKVTQLPPVKLELRAPSSILVLRRVRVPEIGRKPDQNFIVRSLRNHNPLVVLFGDDQL
jgi:hypothetical protein